MAPQPVAALDGLLAPASPAAPTGEPPRAALVELKADPSPAGLESLLTEVAKLQRLRALDLPTDLLAAVARKTRQAYPPAGPDRGTLRAASAAAPLR